MNPKNQMIIKSFSGSELFRIGPRQGDYLEMELEVRSLRASTRIYLYDDNGSFLRFFEDLSKSWKGWEGPKSWKSLEEDLKISCTVDKLGHVSFVLEMTNGIGDPQWTVKTTLKVDSGSLENIFDQARTLFA
ncbi:MAG: DUF6228 family protein [Bdellovibrionia bacterium]